MEPTDVNRFDRELRALTRKATHDPEAFAQAVELLDQTDAMMRDAARKLIADGFSWSDIGRALKITRAGAHRRYART